MLASTSEAPLTLRGWIYEPKYDGIRALIDVRPGHVAIYSRNGNDKTRQFPAIASAFLALGKKLKTPVLLDGEIVAVDDDWKPLGFQHVQGRIHLTSASDIARAEATQPATIFLFDILRDGNEDVRPLPQAERRLRLQQRIKPAKGARPVIRLSEIAADDGRALMARAKREGWEGLIAKDGQSRYLSDKRTPAWRKIKLLNEEEFVVGGWTEPRETRKHFGALLLGYYEGGELRYAGLVGTGFDGPELDRLFALLSKRESKTSPFADRIKTQEKIHWVKPELVVEVRFTEWTSDKLLRQPVYLGQREDKRPKEVSSPRKTSKPAPPAETGTGDELLDRLTWLERNKKDEDLKLPNGDTLRVTNLSKLFWSSLKITKGDLLRYYVEVAPLILPCVEDRPMVMKRFPNGVDKHAFYQQRHPETPPPGVRRMVLPDNVEPITEEGPRDRLIGGSLTTLLYMTQLAAVSQDPWFSRVQSPFDADYVAIDLDPGDEATFAKVLDVARWVKDEIDKLSIPALPKTSGSSGLHIYIPLPPGTSYDTGQLLCQVVATIVATKHPKVATVERWVKRRPRGTVYVDYLQNILGKTIATAYSARASDYAGVSTPLRWQEVAKGVDPRDFTIRTAPDRFREVGDLWKPLRSGPPVNLKKVLRALPPSAS